MPVSSLNLILIGIFVRLSCLCLLEYSERLFQIPLTDVDYYVFSDASAFVSKGLSPYKRFSRLQTDYRSNNISFQAYLSLHAIVSLCSFTRIGFIFKYIAFCNFLFIATNTFTIFITPGNNSSPLSILSTLSSNLV